MNPLFETTSEVELLAINRALLEAKFSGNPNDDDIPGSTLVAEVARRVATSLNTSDPKLRSWFIIDPTRREWRAALLHAVTQRAHWSAMAAPSRNEYIRALLAPFQTSDELVAHFADEIERHLQMGLWYSIWQSIHADSIHLVTKRPARDRAGEIVVVAADGKSILFRSTDEFMVTEWLSENSFEFVANGLLPAPTTAVATSFQ